MDELHKVNEFRKVSCANLMCSYLFRMYNKFSLDF